MHIENDSAQTLVTTAETIIATIPAYALYNAPPNVADPEPLAPQPTVVTGVANLTPGASATSTTIRLRAGLTLAGAVIAVAEALEAGGELEFEMFDPVGNTVGYVLTAAQIAATGNGTINQVSIDANLQ